eukprot:1299305-Prymnesium_polylepis.1
MAIDNPFVDTFFDMKCLRRGGTGDRCDVHVAEAYGDEMFEGLRIDYLLDIPVSIMALFSFAQLGGIPRPSKDTENGEHAEVYTRGVLFWSSWMLAQALQWL